MFRFSLKPLLATLLLLFLAAPALPARASQPSPAELARKIQDTYRQVNSISGDFLRKSTFVAAAGQGSRDVEATGKLYWKRPLMLRLDEETPKPVVVVADGNLVWWVRHDRKRADMYPIDDFTSGMSSLLQVLSGLANLDETYKVVEPEPGEVLDEAYTLVLEPVKSRADLGRLVVWVSPRDMALYGFRLTSLVGDVNQYTLSDVRMNPELSDELFSFTPPEDYRVGDHRPLAEEEAPKDLLDKVRAPEGKPGQGK